MKRSTCVDTGTMAEYMDDDEGFTLVKSRRTAPASPVSEASTSQRSTISSASAASSSMTSIATTQQTVDMATDNTTAAMSRFSTPNPFDPLRLVPFGEPCRAAATTTTTAATATAAVTTSAAATTAARVIRKPPPIVLLQKPADHLAFTRQVRSHTQSQIRLKYSADSVRIFCETSADHRVVKDLLLSANESTEFYTYTLTEDKPVAMVLRGLPKIELPVIVEAIGEKGQTAVKCARMTGPSVEMPLYKVDFTHDSSVRHIKSKVKVKKQKDIY